MWGKEMGPVLGEQLECKLPEVGWHGGEVVAKTHSQKCLHSAWKSSSTKLDQKIPEKPTE
jgi:hypothetical protein